MQQSWVIQLAGDSNCSMRYFGDAAPEFGADGAAPAGSLAAPFVPYQDDESIFNYSIDSNDNLVYCPAGATPYPIPNVLKAKDAIQHDSSIPSTAQIELLSYVSLLDDYPSNPTGSQDAWAALKLAFSTSWLTPAVASAIESDCASANISLSS